MPEQELLYHVSVLKDAELLYERGIFPQSTYVFRHALTREVVYDSILTKRRKLLHQKIGNIIENSYRDILTDHYGALVEHFLAGDADEKGARYGRLASKKAEKTASLSDAILYAEKGIACLERLPASEEVQIKIIDARTVLGLYLTQMNYFCKAKEIIDPIMESAAQRGYNRRLAQIYTVIGAFDYSVEEDFPRALEHLTRALELAEQTGDMLSAVLASYYLAVVLASHCQFEEALSLVEKAIEINMAANNLWGVSAIKSTHSYFQLLHGQVELSYQTSGEALRLAEQSGDIYSRSIGHSIHGYSCYGGGYLEEARDHLSKAVDLGKRCNPIFLVPWRGLLSQKLALRSGNTKLPRFAVETPLSFLTP